jgi:hypothetical protein
VPANDWAAFYRRVIGDPACAQRLRALAPDDAPAAVRDLATELGFDVTDDDIARALQAGRLAWLGRWTT